MSAGKRTYIISDSRETAETARLDLHMWPENGYTPDVNVKVYLTGGGLRVEFLTVEDEVRATLEHHSDPVCMDSCVEFFVNFMPEVSGKYMNFEINPLGSLFIGFGECREKSVYLDDDRSAFDISCSVAPDGLSWTAAYTIPYAFIEARYGAPFIPEEGRRLRGNFYKCADAAKLPHYWVWNRIDRPEPDYHRPESFGDLIIQKG